MLLCPESIRRNAGDAGDQRTADGFKSCGDETAVAAGDDKEAILDALAQETMEITALIAATALKRAAVQRALKRLLADRRVDKRVRGARTARTCILPRPLDRELSRRNRARGGAAPPGEREILLRTRIVVGQDRMAEQDPRSGLVRLRAPAGRMLSRAVLRAALPAQGKHDHPLPRAFGTKPRLCVFCTSFASQKTRSAHSRERKFTTKGDA